MREFIMQMRPFFGADEKQAICDYMDEDGFLTEFRRTEQFEQAIAEYTGAKHCIVVNNGTISLTLAALALGLRAGDEVIVPNYTMVATPNSQKLYGAKPIFVDVDQKTLCIDIEKLKAAITKNTKAIFLVSANGRFPTTDIAEYENLSKSLGIPMIEDAAQSLGSFYPDGRHIGRAGAIGSFSFSAPKIISTGQGGALITDSDEIAYRIRRLKDFGRAAGGNDMHDTIGYNFKFTELQAVIGLEQIKKLTERVTLKKLIWSQYQKNLHDVDEVATFNHDLEYTTPWFIDTLVERRDELIAFLKQCQIGTRVMYPPITGQVAYGLEVSSPVAELVGQKGLWLPSSIDLTEDDISYICDAIKQFYRQSA